MAQAVTALCFILYYSLDFLKQKSLSAISSKLAELGEIQVAVVTVVGPCKLQQIRYGRIIAGKCYGECSCCS